jgi:Domain of unknown function (DUF4159)
MAGRAYWKTVVAVSLGALLLVPGLEAWQRFRNPFSSRRPTEPVNNKNEKAEFFFTRLMYNGGGWGRRGGAWATDWPEADQHFMQGVRRLTNIDAAKDGRILRPLDDQIFDNPWIYGVEVGRWDLEQEEADKLREYLLRGGFLVVDDFHGTAQWESFMVSMRRIFPDQPITEIESTDPLLHLLYDLDERTQIPGIQYVYSGRTYERDGYVPHWRGIRGDDGRLMVAINFNMDLGDAWEHADNPEYPEPMTALAYRFGINYIIYAMTH